MADDTKITINLETVLRGLDKTLQGLSRVEKQLKAVASIKVGGATASSGFDKATLAATRLQQQQKRLEVQAATLANREERARQTTERLARSRDNLTKATERAANTERRVVDRSAREVTRIQRQTEVQARRNERERTRAAKTIADVEIKEAKRGASTLIRTLQQQSDAATQLSRRLSGLGNSLRSIGQGAAQVGLTLSATVTAPLVALAVGVTRAATTLDSLTRGLTAITGSAEEANKQLTRLETIAKLPGIGFEEAIQGSIRLQAVGFSAAQAEASLVQFANAVALTGGGRDELARVTVQLGQLAAKGKVLSQDLRPIIEAAPAVGRALLEAFGTVNADDIQELGLSSRQFLDTLVAQLTKLPRAAAGAKNSFENFRDSVFRAAAVVGEALLPSLTKLIEVAGPIITKLANAFGALPLPVQTATIAILAMVAALGPLTFIFGQLVTGIGRTIVGLVQLNAIGLLNADTFRLLGRVMVGTASLAAGSAATAAVATGGWALLGLAIGAVVASLIALASVERKALPVDVQAAGARVKRVKAVQEEVRFLESLTDEVKLTAEQQEKLNAAYKSLQGAARGRILTIDDEREKLQALIEEKRRLIALDEVSGQAAVVTVIKNTVDALNEQVRAEQALARAKRAANEVQPNRERFAGERQDVFLDRVNTALELQRKRFDEVSRAETNAAEKAKAFEDAAAVLLELSRVTGISVEALLAMGRASSFTEDEIRALQSAINRLAREQDSAVKSVDDLTAAFRAQRSELQKLGDVASAARKTRKDVIEAAAATALEVSDSFEGAVKWMRAFIAANPALLSAIEKERQLAGESLEQFIRSSLGAKPERGATGFRNAQEQLAQALADVAEAAALEQEAIERRSNDRRLQENENAFRLQLKSYRDYLTTRAALTSANLNLEIAEQQRLVDTAVAEQKRFQARLGRKLPAAERERVTAGAAAAEEAQIKAQTRINDLRAEQNAVTVESRQLLAEAAKQQLEDIRALEIEYAELKGSIEDALNAATDEKFRDVLRDLTLAQDDLNRRLNVFGDILSAEQKQEIELARAQNQRQIDAINAIITQERALNRLSAINELVNRAKQQQSELEKQIANDVDLRGLSEEQAIARRLAGEEKVKQSLLVARDIAQDTIDQLRETFGAEFPVPQALLDFIRQVNIEVQGLGKLTFTEQFRLAEKEFNRIQDELVDKINDVERAIRSRDIAEVQGRLIIRQLNGEYVGDLERQLELLKQIAEQSGDEALKRQAAQAAQTTKDIRAAADETENFGKQLKSVAIDSFSDSLSQLFKDLRDNTENAAQDILNFFNNILNRVNDFIAENLAREIAESLFPDPASGKRGGVGGLIDAIKGIFGGGGGQGAGAAGTAVGAAAQETAAATATAAALTTGGTAAGTAMATGGATAAATLATGATAAGAAIAASITAAATAFSAAVIAAGAAFAAAVVAAAGTQAATSIGSGIGDFALGDFLPPKSGGRLIRVAEAGHAEAVLTTDPKYALRQVAILREFLRRATAVRQRIQPVPEFASGGLVSAREAEINLLSTIQRSSSASSSVPDAVVVGGGGGDLHLRQIIVDDERRVGDFINSPQGEEVLNTWLYRNAHKVTRITGRRN